MKLSSKTITAIKLFIDLSEHCEEGFISLIDVAKRKEISKKFLEQIVPLYKTKGLLICSRGNQGGYALGKPAKEIKLKDIIYVSESSLQKDTYNYPPIDETISALDNLIEEYLSSITLKDLTDKQKEIYINSYII